MKKREKTCHKQGRSQPKRSRGAPALGEGAQEMV